jgi:hypothetical protein
MQSLNSKTGLHLSRSVKTGFYTGLQISHLLPNIILLTISLIKSNKFKNYIYTVLVENNNNIIFLSEPEFIVEMPASGWGNTWTARCTLD